MKPVVKQPETFRYILNGEMIYVYHWLNKDNTYGGVVASTAKVDPSVFIAPCSLVGPFSVIGAKTVIQERVIIQSNVTIGENCIINNGTSIHSDTILGNYVTVRKNSVVTPTGLM